MNRTLSALAACLLALAACAGTPVETSTAAPAGDSASAEAADAATAGFDRNRSDSLLAEARAAEAAGRTDEAIELYRQAGLAWPDNVDAWTGLRDLAAARGLAEERAAAQFMVGRVTLYSSEEFYVQREVNRALQTWIAEQRAVPGANPVQLAYADNLASFYDWQYASRGEYQPPSRIINARAQDIPAVILSVGGLAGYIGALASSAGNGN